MNDSAQPLLLGIDVGTSSVKVVATNMAGQLVAEAAARYPTTTHGDSAEQDPQLWWNALCHLTPRVVNNNPVLAVAVTSQAPTLVPVDRAGVNVGPAYTWLDRRARREAELIASFVPNSRNGADPFFGTAKIPWLLANRPEIARMTSTVLAANGFIAAGLTGVRTLDDSTASLMQGFDEETNAFDSGLMGANLGLDLLPPIVRATDVVGHVTAQASASTGIPQGTPVAAGGIDAIGSALEAGAVQAGDPLVDMTGFSSVTMLAVPAGTHIPGFIHARHCLPGVDLLITAQVTAGATIDWVNSLGRDGDLRDVGRLLARPRPSRLTFVPSLAGDRTPTWNASSRGIIDGIDLATDGTELMLAAMEGNALALANDLDTLRAHGFNIDRIISTGGGASSGAWLQIKADVSGLTVSRPATGHGAAQGASYLAGMAVGVRSSASELKALSAEETRRFSPDPTLTESYVAKRERFNLVSILNTKRGAPTSPSLHSAS